MSDRIDIEVELPERKRQSFGSRSYKPRATVVIAAGSDAEERCLVPVAVGRSLKRKLDLGELVPQSRAEVLWHIGERARACAVRRVEDLLNRRDYTEAELRQKLRDDGYASAVIDDVLERACKGGAVNDKRFAETFIRSKIYAGWGRLRIERELGLRGIDAESLEGWPYEYLDNETEAERAYELASRRRLTGKNDYAKLMRFLVSRGFSSSDAARATRKVLAEAEDESES